MFRGSMSESCGGMSRNTRDEADGRVVEGSSSGHVVLRRNSNVWQCHFRILDCDLFFCLQCLLFQPLLLPSRSPWPNMYPSIDGSMMQFRTALYRLHSRTHLLPLSLLQSHNHPVSLHSPPAACRHMTCFAPEPRVYSISTLLHLAHDPEIKPISLVQREKIREVIPEIVMSRKMRKSLEFNAIQERLRIKALARPSGTPSKDVRVSTSTPSGTSLPQQPQRQSSKARKQRKPNNVMEEVSWRTFRLPFVAV